MGLGFVIHVSKIGCVNIPGTDSHYPYSSHLFIRTGASSFTMFQYVSSVDTPTYKYYILPVCTAQGGGGSFKDRKPIGEVPCCDAWMAGQFH